MATMYKKQVYVSNYIGLDTNDKPLYTEPIIIYGYISQPQSNVNLINIGMVKQYDRTILLDIGDNTEFINEKSLLWVDVFPNESNNNMDYDIVKLSDKTNRTFTLYIKGLANDNNYLYYANSTDDNAIKINLNFDISSKIAITPTNFYFPLTTETKVWYKKPTDVNDTNSRLYYGNKELINNNYKITFI